MILVGWLVYQAREAVLLFITAAILATGLHQCAIRLSQRFAGPRKLWVAIIVLALIGSFVGVGFLAGPQLSTSFHDLRENLNQSWQQISSTGIMEKVLDNPGDNRSLVRTVGNSLAKLATDLGNIVASVFQIVTSVILIFALTLFLVADPGLYQRGFLSLFPGRYRPRFAEVLEKVGESLWFWLTGQALAMVTVGTLTGLGLWLIGMEFALMLGLIAALLTIIPYLGPFLSAIPGIVLALAQSPREALFACAVYAGVEFIEGNFITPTVQRSRASLPPVLTLISTVALGLVFGILGFIIATPLALVVLVVYRELYPEVVLGETK